MKVEGVNHMLRTKTTIWSSVLIIPPYKVKGEIPEGSNYRGMSLLSMVEKNIFRDPSRQSLYGD